MIVVKEFPNKEFATKEELFAELKANKSTLIAQKKMITKEADATVHCVTVNDDQNANKSQGATDNPTKLKAELVINTTNLLDSHGDVHIKGIWNKSAKESKNILLLQEHRMTFDHIITDKVQASVNEVKWKDLGLNFNGTTEALTFNVEIDKERNPFMFEQYAKGYVNQHSVGMRYVKLELALNSESKYDIDEKAVWDKYYNEIANKEVADEQGYFWAVTEAKIIEGSAVVRGSNYATPTISVEAVKDTSSEQNEPSIDTQAFEQLKSIIHKI
jgi:hypothetical protein